MRKPLKVAAWSGLISLILAALILPLNFISTKNFLINFVVFISSLAVGIFSILFIYGFVALGKRFKNKLLVVVAWIGIGFSVVAFIVGILFNLMSLMGFASAQQELVDISPEITGFLIAFLFLFVVFAVISGVYSVLFGVGILKLKDKVPYAKAVGILDIVAGATYIILIGFLIRIVAFIFEIVLLFKASKKFEK